MDASRSATIYTRDVTSAQQFLLYLNIRQTTCFDHSSGHHQVPHRDNRFAQTSAILLSLWGTWWWPLEWSKHV